MMSFRNLTESDFQKIRELVSEAWYKKVFESMSPEKADQTFKGYLGHYLHDCTFAEVCEIDGEFAGFLVGHGENEELMFPGYSNTRFETTPWIIRHLLNRIFDINRDMLAQCNDRGFDSELSLYVTDSRFRGQGVGSALLERFIAHLKDTGHRKMYLFTDDFCSVGYYMNRGFKEEISTKIFIEWKFHKFMILSIELQ